MNESQTRLLIQRELDGRLTQEEETRLRRVLMVNDSAVSFRASLSQVVAAARDLELPDEVRPGDSSQLAVEIIEKLPVVKGNFWDPLFDIFAGRKSANTDPRSTRSVGSAAAQRVSSNSNQASVSASGAQSRIDPAVLSPNKESARDPEKEKTPQSLPAVDQFLTGTHSAVGGLAKKLRKDFNNTQTEDVGKTLAEAIREKVHESHNSAYENHEQVNALMSVQSTTHSFDGRQFNGMHSEVQPEQPAIEFPTDAPAADAQLPSPSQSFVPSFVLPLATPAPHIVPANITIQDLATSVNLGNSMVLTVSPQVSGSPALPQASPTSQSSANKGHDFAAQDLVEWKSGTFPVLPPPTKKWVEAQAETGPLAPFPINASPSMAKLNLKDTAEIMKQLSADSQREKPQFPQWVTPTTFNAEPAPAKPDAWPTHSADPWTAWVPPPTPENPAPPADPWAPPSAPAPQSIQDPWAPQTVQTNNPAANNSWVQHPAAANHWAPETPPVPAPIMALPVPIQAPLPVPMPSPVPAPMPAPAPIQVQKPAPVAPATSSQTAPVAPPPLPQTSNEVVGYEPTIVPVTRNSLPIEAIGERINQLFSEPLETKPPTVVSQPLKDSESPRQENAAMENDVKECLSSIGRLADLRYATNNPGHIKDLGRFLLTDETIESIETCINKGLGHSHARVVTLEAAQQLAVVLEPVLHTPGVLGYMVCGYDGLPISSQLPADVDMELLGGCALVTFMNSHSIMKVMGHTRVNQMICGTPGGCMLLADFGKGILVTLTSQTDAAMLVRLTETIAALSGN